MQILLSRLASVTCCFLALLQASEVVAIEEAGYELIRRDGDFEIRHYAPQVLAEVIVDREFSDAGNTAFRRLAAYIGGANEGRRRIPMTAPVTQEASGTRIAMTAPVGQERRDGGWAVSFLLPADLTLETAPVPTDPTISLRSVPARQMATVRYSGFWGRKQYDEALARLRKWVGEQGLREAGDPLWARYDPPFMPWFLRRNEVLLPVAERGGAASSAARDRESLQ